MVMMWMRGIYFSAIAVSFKIIDYRVNKTNVLTNIYSKY